jgi:DNA-directed RNA polymerase specialized sigma24 family protein
VIPSDKKALAEALKKRMAQKGRPIPPEKRAIFLGAYLGGATVGDAALKAGISPPTAKKIIDQAIAEGTEEK